eukprot:6458092-Pyramimonas_sp.AAC.1
MRRGREGEGEDEEGEACGRCDLGQDSAPPPGYYGTDAGEPIDLEEETGCRRDCDAFSAWVLVRGTDDGMGASS